MTVKALRLCASLSRSGTLSSQVFKVTAEGRRSFVARRTGFLLRHQLTLAFTFRLTHRFPLGNGLDLASAVGTVWAVGAGLGLAEHPLVKLLTA